MANTVASLAAAQDGLIPYHLIAVGSNNATNLKTTSGIIGLVTVYNLAAAPAYIKFYDKATAPVVGTDVPVFVVMAPGNANGGSGSGTAAGTDVPQWNFLRNCHRYC